MRKFIGYFILIFLAVLLVFAVYLRVGFWVSVFVFGSTSVVLFLFWIAFKFIYE